MKVRLALITTCRSDYAAVYWLMHEAFHHPGLAPLLVVGGSHLEERHGLTVREVEEDAWPIAARVPFLEEGDDEAACARAGGRALSAFTRLFQEMAPDAVLLYGDRWELLPIATAAVLTRTPIAHVGGGEVTEGALDEQVRHALTKAAHLHFPCTSLAAQRVLQMGEEPWRVRNVGDPAVDQFVRGPRATVEELARRLGLRPDASTLLVTFHPPTLDPDVERQAGELAAALESWHGPVVITSPAPDPGAAAIRAALEPLSRSRPQTAWVESLGGRRYRGLAATVGALVGNSSSALNEAPCVPLPAVNIGRRQEGRERARNVIDVPADRLAIVTAISEALSPAFRASLTGLRNPYGDGQAARRIADTLAALPVRDTLLGKRFVTATAPPARATGGWEGSTSGPAPMGGEFPMEWPSLFEDGGGLDLFGAGRDALFAIGTRHPGRWLVPAFACPVVPRALRAAGCTLVPYRLLTPWQADPHALEPLLSGAAGIVVPFHLGLPPDPGLWEQARGRGLVVVEDRCQWIGAPVDRSELRGDYAFGSFRKWLAVPDGAWAVARDREPLRPTGPPRRDMVRLRLAAALTKQTRIEGRQLSHEAVLERASVELFALGEADPAAGPLGARASGLAARLAATVDFAQVRAARLRNQAHLAARLADRQSVVLAGPEPGHGVPADVPLLALPVWCHDRVAAWRALADRRIFCPVHWRDGDWAGSGGLAAEWASHLLSLPVDQRYGPADMDRVAEALE